ncbi:MAG TPA: TolC family protein [Chitinophagales bacterium]|nr:TolC family protein [Chitinophagales bacterium]HNL84112.1 TolC family protein [Chitinophagales bacterium]
MTRFKKITALLYLLSLIISASAQDLLTPEDAVAYAVKNNYDIILAKNEADILRINNNKGAAGMLPKINVTTGDVFNLSNIHQELSTGTVTNKNWVPVNSFNAGLNLNWTAFDGLKMFATKDRLQALQVLGELQLKEQIQNTIAQTLAAYFEIVRQKQQLKAMYEWVKLYEERVNLSQKKLDVGYSDKTPLLQAQVDLITQKAAIVKQDFVLQQSKAVLNNLLSRDAETGFDVIDTFAMNYQADLQQLKDTTLNNFSILSAQKNIDIAKLQHKEITAQKLPIINFSTGYNFNQNNSKAGLQLVNRSYGPTVGINAVIPIYNGGIIKKQLEASAVNIAVKELVVSQLKNDLQQKVYNAYKNYEYAKTVLKLNEDAVKTADENVQLSMQRFRLNQTTTLEVKTAQSSYEMALFNVILARYTAKLAEIELRRLTDNFVQIK